MLHRIKCFENLVAGKMRDKCENLSDKVVCKIVSLDNHRIWVEGNHYFKHLLYGSFLSGDRSGGKTRSKSKELKYNSYLCNTL